MIFYLFWFCAIPLALAGLQECNRAKDAYNQISVFIWLLIILFIGVLRSDIGADWSRYTAYFDRYSNSGLGFYESFFLHRDVLFGLVLYFIGILDLPKFIFFGIFYIFGFFGFLYFVFYFKINLFALAILGFPFLAILGFSALRQFAALGFVFALCCTLDSKRFALSLIFSLCAVGFHFGAFLVVGLAWLCRFRHTLVPLSLIGMIGLVFVVFLFGFESILGKIGYYYDSYIPKMLSSYGLALRLLPFIFIFGWWLCIKDLQDNFGQKFIACSVLVFIAVSPFGIFISAAIDRLLWYLFPALFLACHYCIGSVSNPRLPKLLFAGAVGMVYHSFWLIFGRTSGEWIPYASIFS